MKNVAVAFYKPDHPDHFIENGLFSDAHLFFV